MKQIFVEALNFFKESGADLANGPSNRHIIEEIESLYDLGVYKIEVALYPSSEDDQNIYDSFDSEIFLHFESDLIHTDVMVTVVLLRPDEISYEKALNGAIRLWWD